MPRTELYDTTSTAEHVSAEPWTKQTLLRHLHEQHRHDRSRLGDTKAGLVEWHVWIHDGE